MKRTRNHIAAWLAGLAVLVVAGAAAAAGIIPFLSPDEGAAILLPAKEETTTAANPIATILSRYEWVLALIAVLIFLAIAFWGFRHHFDLLSRHNENTLREPWE